MRYLMFLTAALCLSLVSLGCTSSTEPTGDQSAAEPQTTSVQTVEAACASCIYEMEGVEDCELAVKIDGKPYLVSGVDVDAHESGLCDAAKSAAISGEIDGDRFVATSFEFEQ